MKNLKLKLTSAMFALVLSVLLLILQILLLLLKCILYTMKVQKIQRKMKVLQGVHKTHILMKKPINVIIVKKQINSSHS